MQLILFIVLILFISYGSTLLSYDWKLNLILAFLLSTAFIFLTGFIPIQKLRELFRTASETIHER